MEVKKKTFGLAYKIVFLSVSSVLVAVGTLIFLGFWQIKQYHGLARNEVDAFIQADLDHITGGVYSLVKTENEAVQIQVDQYLKIAKYILSTAGEVRFSSEIVDWDAVNQLTGGRKVFRLPRMYVGERPLVNDPDPGKESAVVDTITRLIGEPATVFQRVNGEGDMMRAATSIIAPDGKRALGSYIPVRNPDGTPNPVLAQVLQGRRYIGRAYVVSEWYLAAYDPLFDKSGKVVGMLFVGIKLKTIEARVRQAIIDTRVGKTGYVYVIQGTGPGRGRYIVSQGGHRDGENVWDSRDEKGNFMIRAIVGKALILAPGQMATESYWWKNPEDPGPRLKIARLAYYAPWDWVIGTSVYEDELDAYRSILLRGRFRMAWIMGLAGLSIMVIIGFASVFWAGTLIRPLRRVTSAAKIITEGGMTTVSGDVSPDEIGLLSEAFNIMVARLQENIKGLQDSQRWINDILEFMPDAVLVTDIEKNIIYWNHAMEELTGVSKKDMLGKAHIYGAEPFYGMPRKHLIDLLDKDDAELASKYSYVTRKGEVLYAEAFAPALNQGRGVYIWAIARFLRDSSGRIVGTIESVRDISAYKEKEKALLLSQERYRRSQEIGHVGNWEFDIEKQSYWASDEAKRIFGFASDGRDTFPLEEIERRIENWELVRKRSAEMFRSGKDKYSLEYALRPFGPEGARWVLSVSEVQRSSDGTPVKITGLIQDITERKLSADALYREKEFARALLENMVDAVIACDAAGSLVLFNKAAREWHGMDADGSIGPDQWSRRYKLFLADGVTPIPPDQVPLRRALSGEIVRNAEFVICDDGRPRVVLGNCAPFFDMEGKQLGAVGVMHDVTDLKRAENEVKTWKYRYDLVGAISGQVLYEYDVASQTIIWGPTISDVLGYSPEEFGGGFSQWADALHPDDKGKTIATLEEAGRKCSYWEAEYRLRHKNGGYVWLLDRGLFVGGSDNKALQQIGMMENITPRKHVEEALRNSEERFRSIVESSPSAMYFYHVEQDGRLILMGANPAADRIIGIKHAALVGKTLQEAFPELADTFVPDMYRKVALGEMPSQAFEISYKDARFSGYYSVNVFRTGSFSLAVDFVDISERKRIEDAVRNERDFSTSLVQSSPVFYVAIRADGSIVMANNAMLSAVGYTQQEVSGADYISKFCIPEQRDKVSGIFKRIVIENKMDLSESFVVAKDGRRLLVEWRGVPVFKGGDLDFFFGVGIDITRRKEAEEEIKKLNSELEMRVADRTRQLEDANKELEAFSYSVSHDLRAPLRAVDGFSLALFEDYSDKLDEKGRDYIGRVRGASQRMAQLIDDMLLLSRVTRRDMVLAKVDLSFISHSIIDELRSGAPDRKVDVRIQEGMYADADAGLIKIALSNLISNSWKFTSKHPAAVIEVGCAGIMKDQSGSGKDIGPVYFVRDDGAGFDMEYARNLFGPFQRMHTTADFEGTGIGLATVQRIIRRHGGRIWAESAVERGASFYFTLSG